MTRRRRVLLGVLGLALAGVAVWAFVGSRPLGPPGVTRENAYRLRPGMSLEEAEAILGPHVLVESYKNTQVVQWDRDGIAILAYFSGRQDGVVNVKLIERQPDGRDKGQELFGPAESLLERVRRWLGL